METVIQTRHTSGAKGKYGLPSETSVQISLLASVAPRTATTTVGASETTISEGLTLYAPSATEVHDDDLFTVRGVVYSIDGEAFDWQSGLGSWKPGTVIHLQRLANG